MSESNKAFTDFVKGLTSDAQKAAKPDKCNGRIYRAAVNTFLNSRGDIVYKELFRFMKRMSCKGCEQCGYLSDDLHEELACQTFKTPADVEHGALYRLATTNIGYDYETGICDSWDIELIKIK